MRPEHLEMEQAQQRELANHHRRIAERLVNAGYWDLASVHLLEAKLAELNAAAIAASARAA
jgi:hypothetical protein